MDVLELARVGDVQRINFMLDLEGLMVRHQRSTRFALSSKKDHNNIIITMSWPPPFIRNAGPMISSINRISNISLFIIMAPKINRQYLWSEYLQNGVSWSPGDA